MIELVLTTEHTRPGNISKRKDELVLKRLRKIQVDPSDQVQSSYYFDRVVLSSELARPRHISRRKGKLVLNSFRKSQVEPRDQVQSSKDFD